MQPFGYRLANFFVLQMKKLKLIEHAATCLISEKCGKEWWLLIPAMVFSSLSLCFWLWAPLAAVCWPYLCASMFRIGPILQDSPWCGDKQSCSWPGITLEPEGVVPKRARPRFTMCDKESQGFHSGWSMEWMTWSSLKGHPHHPGQSLILHPLDPYASPYIHQVPSVLELFIVPCGKEHIWAWNPKV